MWSPCIALRKARDKSVPEGSFTIKAGWLMDGTGTPARRGVAVSVRGGMIVSLDDSSPSCPCPADWTDLSSSTILPGLVDCHVHLFMSGTVDPALRRRQLAFSFDEARPAIEAHLRRHLLHGIVAVRDGGDYGGHALMFRNKFLPAAHVPPYVRCAGRAWRAQGRYGTLIGRPPSPGRTLAEAISRGEENADHVKIVNSGLNSLKIFGRETAAQFSADELSGAVRVARALGLRTMVHANGRIPVVQAVQARCDSVEHGYFMGADTIAMMAEQGICWVPTALTMKAYSEHASPGSVEKSVAGRTLDAQIEQLSRAREAGVTVAVGTDCGSLGVDHGSSFPGEMGLLRDAGFSIEEAVMCATFNGARLLGLEGQLGRLAVGMPATFVAVNGGPRSLPESLRSVDLVYVRGKRVV